MRWLFADPKNPEEAARVQRMLTAIDHWWRAFQAKAGDLEALFARRSEWDLPRFMEDTLQAIHPQLMWEFGPAVRQPGHRLVITPESHRWLRPVVRTILEKAPKLAGWEFYPYRLAETPQQAIAAVKARVGVDISGALIDASVAPGRKIDLYFSFPGLPDLDEETATSAAFVATETLMGEQVLDTWIGTIGLLDDEHGSGGRPLSLERAQATVAALIRGSLDQLPSASLPDISAGGDIWATVELTPPEEADDYPGQSDLVSAPTRNVELFQAAQSGALFTSACHSKVGELFCYLKLDATDVPSDRIVDWRAAVEKAINSALVQAGVGCCIGGGKGLRYVYVELAVTNLAKAAQIIRQTLMHQKAPLRTWLLFHDDDLSAEWFGAYPQTPPPPEEDSEPPRPSDEHS
jgi:hypothetical protein